MFEDVRHENEAEAGREPAWASSSPLAFLARVAVLAAMALAIAVSVSELLGSDPKLTPVLETPQR